MESITFGVGATLLGLVETNLGFSKLGVLNHTNATY